MTMAEINVNLKLIKILEGLNLEFGSPGGQTIGLVSNALINVTALWLSVF